VLVVEGLLERPRVYHSEHGCEPWEAAARANLGRELATLRRVAVPLQ
jgi:predicted metal-dependent HD superfamily phosphohydrolase